MMDAASRRLTPGMLKKSKERLFKIVTEDANRPPVEFHVVASTAFLDLHRDYILRCMAGIGGLVIVYDKQGTGKSRALQAVAREQSTLQPHRFLVINMVGEDPCRTLYENIQKRVLGDVQDYEITPEELAEVVAYGLCGELGKKQSLPPTKNKCRMEVISKHIQVEKKRDLPILVFDEFLPSDFTWDKDYSVHELQERLGDAFRFFNTLTGLAYREEGGFVVFVGTKSEAFAHALHKINGGSKARLASATTVEHPNTDKDGNFLFSDWTGLRWIKQDKVTVVSELYGDRLKKALRGQGLEEQEVDVRAINIIDEICSHNDWNIRTCCEEEMTKVLLKEEEAYKVCLQSRAQTSKCEATCSWAAFDMLKFWK